MIFVLNQEKALNRHLLSSGNHLNNPGIVLSGTDNGRLAVCLFVCLLHPLATG